VSPAGLPARDARGDRRYHEKVNQLRGFESFRSLPDDRPIAKTSHSLPTLTAERIVFGGVWMPSMQIGFAGTHLSGQNYATQNRATADRSTDWRAAPSVTDDECLALLAKAVEDHDPESLDEVAWLIGRLAVPIE
jgi:hypothetical protein